MNFVKIWNDVQMGDIIRVYLADDRVYEGDIVRKDTKETSDTVVGFQQQYTLVVSADQNIRLDVKVLDPYALGGTRHPWVDGEMVRRIEIVD